MAFKKASPIVSRMDAGYECIRVYLRVVIGSETMFYLAIAEIKPLSMIWKTPQEKKDMGDYLKPKSMVNVDKYSKVLQKIKDYY